MNYPQQFAAWLEEKVNIESLKKDFVAGVDIPAGTAVYMETDGLIYPYTTGKQDQYIGVTNEYIGAHCKCTITMNGYLKVAGSGWQKGFVYYVHDGGSIFPTLGDAKIAVGVARDAILVFNNLSEIDYFILTTLGNSGPATLTNGNLLNIPNYTLSGLGGVPTTRQLTINGVTYDLSADRSWTTVSSVGLAVPPAFTVSGSPITSSGVITIGAAGSLSQYVRGDGTLADFPSVGGGSSVNYYLNGSVNQGTFGGDTYYQLNKVAILGAGTDFSTAVDGYVAEFITDVGDPGLLNIPAGAWNIQCYMSASSAGGTPSFYVELYKYDGVNFTLIATSVGTPEYITNGTSIDLYYTSMSVPATTLLVTDRLAVRIYVTVDGRTITLHTEDSHLGVITTTFATGMTALNGLTTQVQYLAVGTSGLDFNISSVGSTHTFNLPDASQTARGVVTIGSQDFAGVKTFHDTVVLGEVNGDGQVLLQLPAGGSWLYRENTGSLYGFDITLGVDNSIFWLNQEGSGHQCIYYGDGYLNLFGFSNSGDGGLTWNPRFVINANGYIGINKNNPTAVLDVAGDGIFSSNLTALIPALATPATRYVVSDGGMLKYRTPSELLSDAGAVPSSRSITINGTTYDLSADRSWAVGTVTSVAALTLGTAGTDLSSTVANGTTTPVITLNVPTASATNRGALSAADWSTFNSKQNAVTLTTNNTGGAATFVADTLNVPNYLDASYAPSVINSNTVLTDTRDTHVYAVDLSGGALTVTLPSAVGNIATIHLKRLGTNNVLTVNTQLGQLVDGSANVQSIQPLTSLMFVAYNNNWYIV